MQMDNLEMVATCGQPFVDVQSSNCSARNNCPNRWLSCWRQWVYSVRTWLRAVTGGWR